MKTKNPFILFINTLVNGGETDKEVKLPAELEESLKSVDNAASKFFADLQAPAKKSGRKSKLDEELKVDSSNRAKSVSIQRSTPTRSAKEDKELEQ